MAFKGIDVKYSRNDLHCVGTTNPGCLVVYPPAKKARQKVAVGDASGSALVFSLGKHHELKEEFKTPALPKPVSRLTLYQDQLFTINGATLNAYTKKGKNFFGFDSNLTETIKSLCIETPYIYCGGEYVLTTFQESQEQGFYMAPDKINDMIAVPSNGQENSKCDAYLGCQDRYLRVIRENKQISEGSCEAALTALTFAKSSVDKRRRDVVYGTAGGSIGAFSMTVGAGGEVTRKYAVMPAARAAAVTCITTCDVRADGMPHIVVARDDGSVEFHAVGANAGGNMGGADGNNPTPIWKANVNETVTGIAVGAITGSETDEIVLSTFSGKIISFAQSDAGTNAIVPNVMTGKVDMKAAAAAPKAEAKETSEADRASSQVVLAAKVKEVERELAALRDSLAAKQKEYTAKVHGANAPAHKQAVAVASEFHVRAKWELETSACLGLALEVDAPIDTVCLRSDVSLEIFDEVEREAANIVVSMGSPQLQVAGAADAALAPTADTDGSASLLGISGASKTLCVLRPSDSSSTRLEVHFRPLEGNPGEIQAFVTPKLMPRTAQLKTFPIHALCLHQRIAGDAVEWEQLPMSTLKMSGPFSARDVHAWLFALLPGVPEALTQDTGSLYFKNTFVGSYLFIRYSKGEAEFKSENVSTLAIIRETVTREATQRKIAVKLASDPSPASIAHTLRLLHPLVGKQLKLAQQLKILDALKEIEGQEEDRSFLSEDHKAILASANAIQNDMRLQPKRTEYLKSLIVRLFKDKAMFRGEVTPVSRLKELDHLLEHYDEAQIEAFFK